MSLTLNVRKDSFPLARTFSISRGSRNEANVVCVELSNGKYTGRGESVPYARYDESVEGVIEIIESLQDELKNGLDRHALQTRLPAGAARNALDCAFWDLEAKQLNKPVFELAGLTAPEPCVSAVTISLETPEKMLESAKEYCDFKLLKVKLGGEGDRERLQAVRDGAPNSDIIVDANEGWNENTFEEMSQMMMECGVKMVEQPLPADNDEALRNLKHPVPICADESCHDRSNLTQLIGKYDMVNIKLDKTGGLSEALALRDEAQKCGFKIMVGSMVSSSLSMAPALLVAQNVDYVDLDSPLLLAQDRENPMVYIKDTIQPAQPELWG